MKGIQNTVFIIYAVTVLAIDYVVLKPGHVDDCKGTIWYSITPGHVDDCKGTLVFAGCFVHHTKPGRP